jgi:hypothetical protein
VTADDLSIAQKLSPRILVGLAAIAGGGAAVVVGIVGLVNGGHGSAPASVAVTSASASATAGASATLPSLTTPPGVTLATPGAVAGGSVAPPVGNLPTAPNGGPLPTAFVGTVPTAKPAPSPTPVPPPSGCRTWSACINQDRAAARVPALTASRALDNKSLAWAHMLSSSDSTAMPPGGVAIWAAHGQTLAGVNAAMMRVPAYARIVDNPAATSIGFGQVTSEQPYQNWNGVAVYVVEFR